MCPSSITLQTFPIERSASLLAASASRFRQSDHFISARRWRFGVPEHACREAQIARCRLSLRAENSRKQERRERRGGVAPAPDNTLALDETRKRSAVLGRPGICIGTSVAEATAKPTRPAATLRDTRARPVDESHTCFHEGPGTSSAELIRVLNFCSRPAAS
jgi:hypothetical protein